MVPLKAGEFTRKRKTVEQLAWAQPNPDHGDNPKTDATNDLKGEDATDKLVFPGNGIYPVCGTVVSSLSIIPLQS